MNYKKLGFIVWVCSHSFFFGCATVKPPVNIEGQEEVSSQGDTKPSQESASPARAKEQGSDVPTEPPPRKYFVVTMEPVEIRQKITFDDTLVSPDSWDTLNAVAALLFDRPSMKIKIEGHMARVGSERVNQQMSEERAKNVRQYLLEHGVEADRLTSEGYGSTHPLPNIAADDLRNNRIEFVILQN